jgi:pimeloyl-ACP methyl ester carboxylesterase
VSARRIPRAETGPALRGTVLFVHGLWLTGAESFLLKRHLAAAGWALRVFPYSSLAESMDQVARRCARFALSVARRTLQPVHLVGHSLGGMVIYRMFETGLLAPDRFSGDFCRVVFMGTPVRGSQSARVLANLGPARRLLGLAGAEDLQCGLPSQWTHRAELGLIAGNSPRGLGRLLNRLEGANDGTVAVSETELAGARDHCVLPVSHTGMLLSAISAAAIVSFLDHGRFAASK